MCMSTIEATREVTSEIKGEYACPYCDFTEKTERAVRSHITRADDAAHEGHNGFSPSVVVESPDGEEIGFTTNQTIGDVSTNLISSSVPDELRRIVAYAFQHPNASYAEVQRNAGGDHSYYIVSSTVKEYVEGVLNPTTESTESKTYEDLNDRQKAGVDILAKHPYPSYTELREEGFTDETSSYLSNLKSNHLDIIEERLGHFHGKESEPVVKEVVKEVEVESNGMDTGELEAIRGRLESIANVTTDGEHLVAKEALTLVSGMLNEETPA
jgi:hypothetical protein